ncbi:hypothetical protein FGO68_gene16609 [Halteria grandinella]|uniref:Uncharacterized protein n=1 Tax=Halteria grandinella TaxID=5974 RepID=A0A8J8NKT1_HALGN|nr:hypothetical protein FGO68_gene16609 [Halteria grandinella]
MQVLLELQKSKPERMQPTQGSVLLNSRSIFSASRVFVKKLLMSDCCAEARERVVANRMVWRDLILSIYYNLIVIDE